MSTSHNKKYCQLLVAYSLYALPGPAATARAAAGHGLSFGPIDHRSDNAIFLHGDAARITRRCYRSRSPQIRCRFLKICQSLRRNTATMSSLASSLYSAQCFMGVSSELVGSNCHGLRRTREAKRYMRRFSEARLWLGQCSLAYKQVRHFWFHHRICDAPGKRTAAVV